MDMQGPVTLSTTPPPRKRRRPALSCAECRRRKVKCDRDLPCGPCTASRSLLCSYTVEQLRRSAGSPISARSQLSTASPPRSMAPREVLGLRSGELALVSREVSTSRDLGILNDRVKTLERLLVRGASKDALPTPPAVEVVEAQHAGSLHKSRYFGRVHWVHAFQQVQQSGGSNEKINCCNADRHLPEVRRLLRECKAVVKDVKTRLAVPLPANLDFRSYVPSQEMADVLIQRYLQTQEATYRILHIPSFQREYAAYWQAPDSSSTEFVLQLILVMAVGSGYYHGVNSDLVRWKAQQWVTAIQHLMALPSGKSRLNVAVLQIQCLLLLARQTTGVDEHLIYISAGATLREAISMGYHRDPQHFTELSCFQGEMRRRLWTTIVEMDLQFSLDSGLPPLLSLDDFDTTPPANINDADIESASQGPVLPKAESIFTNTSIQLALSRSQKLRLQTINLINNLRSEASYEETLRLSNELTSARKQSYHSFLPDIYTGTLWSASSTADVTNARMPRGPTPLQHGIMDLMTLRFILALHRSFVLQKWADPRFYYSRKLSLDTALTMLSHLSGTSNFYADAQHGQDESTGLKGCGGTPSKEVIIHTSLVIISELIFQLEEEPSTLLDHGKSSRAPLYQALRELIDIHAIRVRLGENFKGHFFLSMALGQVEAMEEKGSVTEGILRGARLSAAKCVNLWESRLENILGTKAAVSNPARSYDAGSAQNLEFDFSDQDPGLDFFGADSWPFLDWDENSSW